MWRNCLKNPLVHLAVTMWKQAAGRRRAIVFYGTLSLAANAIWLCTPLVVAMLMNAVQTVQGSGLISAVLLPLLLFICLPPAAWLLHGPSRVIENGVAFFVRARFLEMLFRDVTSLPMRWQREHHSGETIDQVQRATTALAEFAESGFEVIYMLARFGGALIILSLFQPWAGAAVMLMTIVVVGVIVLFDRILVEQYTALNKRYNAVAALVQDFLTNVSTVISLRLEQRAGREVAERTMAMYPLARKSWRVNELKWFTLSLLCDATTAGVLLGYIVFAARREETVAVGTFYALYEYLRTISESFRTFAWKYGDTMVRSTRVRAVEHIAQAYEELVRPDEAASLPAEWRRLSVRELCFSHAVQAGVPAQVAGVDLDLARGRFVAFVGKSGSGKSTTLALVRGIHQTAAVEVFCDGRRLTHKLAHVAHRCTLIPQEPEIFAGSIRFNVTLGIEAEEAAILRALQLAQFEPVLRKLPRGLDTDVAEKGVTLSGGEKQRLALARGLFFVRESGSEIVLLDEPTSSVDQLNEWLIYSALKEEFKELCVISALHKLSLLPLFDEVIVFADGCIAERGTMDELLAKDGVLAQMHGVRPRSTAVVSQRAVS